MTSVKRTGRTLSIPSGVIVGVISALVTTLIASGITAKLIENELLNQDHIGYAIMVFLPIAAWIGSVVTYHKIKRRRIMVCLLMAITFYIALMGITALFFGGQYSGAGETSLLILCGCLLSILVRKNGTTGRKQRKAKSYNR